MSLKRHLPTITMNAEWLNSHNEVLREQIAQSVFDLMCDPFNCPKYPDKVTADSVQDCSRTNTLLEQVGNWIKYDNFPKSDKQ